MDYIKDTLDFHIEGDTMITLGKFDGVHCGHQKLIQETCRFRKNGQKVLVFAFAMSPTMLLTRSERRAMLEEMGVDILIECPFIPALITMEPEDFVSQILVDELHARTIVIGEDFHFGYERRGDRKLLEVMGARYGFGVHVVPKVKKDGVDISSSRIRENLAQGCMEKVNEMLGYPFYVTGEIVHGRRVGRTIGVPTTNLIPSKGKLLPPNGVYASISEAGQQTYRGITNIGTKPTVDGGFIGIETYLYECEEDLYGEHQRVRLYHFQRPETKFPSLDELKMQLARDEAEGWAYFTRQKNKFPV